MKLRRRARHRLTGDDHGSIGWRLGYTVVLSVMFLSGPVPYLYFKRKTWL